MPSFDTININNKISGGNSSLFNVTARKGAGFTLDIREFKRGCDILAGARAAGLIFNNAFGNLLFATAELAQSFCPYEPDELHFKRHKNYKHLYEAIVGLHTFNKEGFHGIITVDTDDFEYVAVQHEDFTLFHPPKTIPKGYVSTDFINPISIKLGRPDYGRAKFIELAMEEMGPLLTSYVYTNYFGDLKRFEMAGKTYRVWGR